MNTTSSKQRWMKWKDTHHDEWAEQNRRNVKAWYERNKERKIEQVKNRLRQLKTLEEIY